MSKKRFWGLSVLLVVFLLLSVLALGGCDTTAPPDDDDDENGVPDDPDVPDPGFKTLTIATTGPPPTLDPFNHRSRVGQLFGRIMFDALGGNLYDGAMCLELAESITEVEPGIFEIKIPQGVTFHNGDPVTADDVIFTMKRISTQGGMEGETSIRLPLTAELSYVEKIDDYTIRASYTPDLRRGTWYHTEILPKKYFEEVGPQGFEEHPIGCGAFKFVETDMTSYAVFDRFEDYWGGPAIYREGLNLDRVPMVDRVIFNFIGESTTRVAALLAGDVDLITAVPPDIVELLVNNPNTEVYGASGTMMVTLHINTTKAPFNDKRVRQALAYAINYDLIGDQMMLGFTDVLKGKPFVPPFADEYFACQELFPTVQSPYDYNPEKARALLEEAGVSGISTVIDTYGIYVEQAQVIAQMLGDIGIDASVRAWEAAVIGQEFKKLERDLYYAPIGNGAKNPDWIYRLTSGQVHDHCGYYNEEFEEKVLRAMKMEDSPEQAELLAEAFEIIFEDMPVITVHVPQVLFAARTNVKNYVPHFADRIYYHIIDIE